MTYYELFQLEHYNNVLPPGSGMAPVDDDPFGRTQQTLIDIENNWPEN